MAGEENLIPTNKRTKEEVRENARKGGIASGKARRRKKTMREIAKTMGSLGVSSPRMAAALEEMGVDNSNEYAVVYSLYKKAISGNVRAIELLLKLVGQSLEPQVDIDNTIADTELKKAHKEAITGETAADEALSRLDDILEGMREHAAESEWKTE